MRPPYDVDGHSATTDLYKLAKLMIRCLSEDLASDAIHYDKFSNVLPSRDFERLHKLLTLPDPGLTADDLGNLARAWQATVRPDSRLFCRTNRSPREPWTEENRQAHLAGLEPPKVPAKPKDVSIPSSHHPALAHGRLGTLTLTGRRVVRTDQAAKILQTKNDSGGSWQRHWSSSSPRSLS
jgi:hypothetical protein